MARHRAGVRRHGLISKRDLLLFDQIWVMGLDAELSRIYGIDPALAADLEFLADRDIAKPAPLGAGELADTIRAELAQELHPLIQELDKSDGELWPSGDGTRRDQLLEAELLASSGRHPASSSFDAELPRGGELLVAFLIRLLGDDAVAVVDRSLSEDDWNRLARGIVVPKSLRGMDADRRVLDVVMRHLPVPSEDTPLEAVLDFVSVPEVRDKAEALRLWMRRVSDANETTDAIELELETLLHDFRQHMKIHRLKSSESFLRAVINVPLGIAEELVHLRPRRALDAVFTVRERRAARIEAELTAPGHAVAYVDAAEQHFAGSA